MNHQLQGSEVLSIILIIMSGVAVCMIIISIIRHEINIRKREKSNDKSQGK